MNVKWEHRNYEFDINSEDKNEETKEINGQAIVFNTETDIGGFFKEVIEPEALNNTDLTDVRFLVNHDISKLPLARSRNNNEKSTMQLIKNENGLAVRVDLDVKNNTEASNLYSAISRGDVSGMSFMFFVSGEEWSELDSDYPTRHITEISKVVEVSAVTFPAYESTSLSATRNSDALDSAKQALDNARNKEEETKRSDLLDSLKKEIKEKIWVKES